MTDFIMRMRILWVAGAASLFFSTAPPAAAQQAPNNDGFQRRNGQMQVVRNGQARPMTHDARLPTGALITKDGFIVAPNGQRTELSEGQGCDLRGRPVAVRATATGAIALAAPVAAPRAAVARDEQPSRTLFAELFGPHENDEGQFVKYKKAKKHHGHGKGKGHGRWKGEDD